MTGANGDRPFFAYSTNYLVDLDNAIIVDVEATAPIRQAEVGDAERVGERDVAQGVRAGAAHGAGHVGHTIMDDVIDYKGWLRKRGRSAGFETPALVDGDIDQHRTRAHGLQHRARDQLWRCGTRYQGSADHEVDIYLLDRAGTDLLGRAVPASVALWLPWWPVL